MTTKTKALVVLPYKQTGAQGKELQLTLKGWRKFCLFDYHFVVIGEFHSFLEEEFPWVEFIYCPQIPKKEGQYNPHLDMQHRMRVVMKKYADTYDGFIWMCDDYYPIKLFELKDIYTVHYHCSSFVGEKDAPTTYWNHDKWKTRQLLDKENLPHINYTIHFPCWFDFSKLNEVFDKFNLREESYVLEDIYFNYFKHPEPILDSEIRIGVWDFETFKNNFQKAINNPNIKFACNSVKGWSKELENSLEAIVS